MKAKISIKNIWAYLVGNYRYKLYHSSIFIFLMRPFIQEQITWRITVMDKQCYNEGSCKMCGCATTALQMANKACDKPCYPTMLNYKEWSTFKTYEWMFDNKTNLYWKYGKYSTKSQTAKERLKNVIKNRQPETTIGSVERTKGGNNLMDIKDSSEELS